MNINPNLFLALGLLLLALEHFGIAIPPAITGVILLIVALVMLV
jgi:hypothetical protein